MHPVVAIDEKTARREVAEHLAEAAQSRPDLLNAAQRKLAVGKVPSVWITVADADSDSDIERRRWFYTPTDHRWLILHQQRRAQQRGALRLVPSGAPEGIAPTSRYGGGALDAGLFASPGSSEPGPPDYYPQAPRLLIDWDNCLRNASRAHSVRRDPEGDFGLEVLADHHATHAQ